MRFQWRRVKSQHKSHQLRTDLFIAVAELDVCTQALKTEVDQYREGGDGGTQRQRPGE